MENFKIFAEIGRGSHSVVYKGREKKNIEFFAIKSAEKSRRGKLLNEVRILHSMSHPNILRFEAWFETRNHLWMILEYCTGGSFEDVLKADGPWPEESLGVIASDMVSALQHLHSLGIIFCDLKPSNLLFNSYGMIKLGDFGLAQRIDDINEDGSNDKMTMGKRGTPSYMAPELFSDHSIPSFASDFWSLGIVLYQVSQGRLPFESSSLQDLLHAILNEPVPKMSNVSPQLGDLITRLLKKDPWDRITWEELCTHPFWKKPFKLVSMPDQPAYEKWESRRKQDVGMTLEEFVEDETDDVGTNGILETAEAQQRHGVDIRRVSLTVKANMKKGTYSRDQDDEDADTPKSTGSRKGSVDDVAIRNVDEEMQFGKGNAEHDEGIDDDDDEDDDTEDDHHHMSSSSSSGRDTAGGSADLEYMEEIEEIGEDDYDDDDDDASAFSAISAISESDMRKPSGNKGKQQQPRQIYQSSSSYSSSTSSNQSASRPSSGYSHTPSGLASANNNFTRPDSAATYIQKRGDALTYDEFALDESEETVDLMELIQSLMFTKSDSSVKPIIHNKRIEPVPKHPPAFDASGFLFTPQKVSHLESMDLIDLEQFFEQVHDNMKQCKKTLEMIHILNYLQSLAKNSEISHIVLGLPLMAYVVKIAKVSNQNKLKTKAIELMGVYIRYATFIDDTFADSNVINVLTEQMRTRNVPLKRVCVATMGELLFYIATQPDQTVWDVPKKTFKAIIRCLQSNEDSIVQHYAGKTIENISAYSREYSEVFAKADVAMMLLAIFNASKDQHVRTTMLSALARLARQNNSLVHSIIDKTGGKFLVNGLKEQSSKIIVNFLNLVNVGLVSSTTRFQNTLIQSKPLVPSLLKLMEGTNNAERWKSTLTMAMLVSLNPQWLLQGVQRNLVDIIEKFRKEKDVQLTDCTDALIESICASMSVLTEPVTALLRKMKLNSKPTTLVVKQLKSAVVFLPVVEHLINSSVFRMRIVEPTFVEDLSLFVKLIEVVDKVVTMDFRGTVIKIVESLAQFQYSPGVEYAFLAHFLPSLCGLLDSDVQETRFLALKFTCDILMPLLNDPNVYDVANPSETTELIDELIKTELLPRYKTQLLTDEGSRFALKVLNFIVDRNFSYLASIVDMGLLESIFEFLEMDHRNNTIPTVKLVQKCVEAQDISKLKLYELGLIRKLHNLLEFSTENQVTTYLDLILDIVSSLLYFLQDRVEITPRNDPETVALLEGAQGLLDGIDIYVMLVAHPDEYIRSKAIQCLSRFVELMPVEECYGFVILERNLDAIGECLKVESFDNRMTLLNTLLLLVESYTDQQQVYRQCVSANQPLMAVLKDLSGEIEAAADLISIVQE